MRSYIENLINNKTANTPNYRYAILAQLLVIPGDIANKILGEKESLYVMDTLENQDVTLRKKVSKYPDLSLTNIKFIGITNPWTYRYEHT